MTATRGAQLKLDPQARIKPFAATPRLAPELATYTNRKTARARQQLSGAKAAIQRLHADLPLLLAAIEQDLSSGFPTSGGDGSGSTKSGHSDPTGRIASAEADRGVEARRIGRPTHSDRASADQQRLWAAIAKVTMGAEELALIHETWRHLLLATPRCSNPLGCPDAKPAVPGRKDLCQACYTHQDRYGEPRATSRLA